MKLISAMAVLIFASIACAQAPATQQIEQELAGPFAAKAAQPDLKERGEVARRVERLILKQCKFLLTQLKPWQEDPRASYIFDGTSKEIDIRSATHVAFGLATIYRTIPADAGDDVPRDVARDRAISILRFVLPTHGAGGKVCADGKPWKNQWQSAYWAHTTGKAAWLLWDELDPQLRYLAARMICDEADRFVGVTPPAQIVDDTKAEENAWNSQIISMAYNMFPNHPHHKQWRETALRWIISSYVCSKDLSRTDLIDGKPLKDWVTKANIYDDYTLENHNRVHPDYMCTTRLTLYQKFDYDWGKNPEPEALRLNADKIYESVKKLAMPDGGWIYPNGQDWQLHRCCDWIDLNAGMAILFKDPQAARMMLTCVETTERMLARNPDTGFFQPDEFLVPTTHATLAEQHSDAYLLMRSMGDGVKPFNPDRIWVALAGKHVFADGKFAVLRTSHAIATFSWGRQVMGMVLPLQKDLLLTPNERSMIGDITTPDGKRDTPIVKRIGVAETDNTLGLAGIIERAGGAVEQRFAFIALADGRTIYADVLKLTGAAKPASVELGTLGVLNDTRWVYHNGIRTLHQLGGKNSFVAADADNGDTTEMSSPWFNLDGLGIVCLKTSGQQVYNAKRSPTRGRLEQMFHLNHISADTLAAAGSQPFAQTVLVFYPDQAWGMTIEVAAKAKFQKGTDDYHFVITLNDGRRIDVDLETLKLGIQ